MYKPLIFGLLFLLQTATAARAEPDYAALNQALTDAVVLPAYQALADTTEALAQAATAACKIPAAERFAGLSRAFVAAMEAWQRAQPLAYGPVTWENRTARIHLWPQRDGQAQAAIERALADASPVLITPAGLRDAPPVLQGFGSLEILIFGMQPMDKVKPIESDYGCALAKAASRSLASLAVEVLEDWHRSGGFREAVATAKGGNDSYFDAAEASGDLLRAIVGALDIVIALKLEPPLGRSINKARPQRAESWRSRRSLANIRANLETAKDLFASPGGFAEQLEAVGARPLADGMAQALEESPAMLGQLQRPLSEAVTNPEHRAQLEVLLDHLRSLRVLARNQLARELDLILGFNATDGD